MQWCAIELLLEEPGKTALIHKTELLADLQHGMLAIPQQATRLLATNIAVQGRERLPFLL